MAFTLKPVLNFPYAYVRFLDPRLTFARNSVASYFTNKGEMAFVAANKPRFDHNPITGESLGVRIEEQRENLFLNSETLSTQGVTVTGVPITVSFYGTGTITFSGAYTGTLVGTGSFPVRTASTFTPSSGTLTCTVTGNVQYAQLEVGSFVTTYIPTTSSTVIRYGDDLSMLSSLVTTTQRSVLCAFYIEQAVTNDRAIYSFNDNSSSNTIEYVDSISNPPRLTLSSSGSSYIEDAPLTIGDFNYSMVGLSSGDNASCLNGANAVTNSSAIVPSVDRLYFGRNQSGSSYLNGCISSFIMFDKKMTNIILKEMSK